MAKAKKKVVPKKKQKRKIIKKHLPKGKKKKIIRKKRKKMCPEIKEIDEFYVIINKVQCSGVEMTVEFTFQDASLRPTAEHILKDIELPFEVLDGGIYRIDFVPKEDVEQLVVEQLDDEIVEEGQLF